MLQFHSRPNGVPPINLLQVWRSGPIVTKHELVQHMWDSDLPPHAKLIFLAILDYRNTKTGECYPSMDTIAQKVGVCRNTVSSCITKIEEAGFFKVKKIRPSGARYTVNSYKYNIQCSPNEQSNEQSNDCSDEQSNERSPDEHKLIKPIEPIEPIYKPPTPFKKRGQFERKKRRKNDEPKSWKEAAEKYAKELERYAESEGMESQR